MLKIQFKDKRNEPFWVMEKTFTIGSGDENHLVIQDDSVSKTHAKLLNHGETFTLRDMGSQAGTYVNGQRINEKEVACGDLLRVGTVELEIIDPLNEARDDTGDRTYWSLIADSSWLSGQEFPITAEENESVIVGRGTQCDIVFPGTHLSRQHAKFTVKTDHLELRDLGSANGTFLNDKKIEQANVRAGDRIRFDVYSFRVFGPGIELPQSATTHFPAIGEKKLALSDTGGPKQWKIKPTSPGNRQEPSYSTREKVTAWIAAIAVIGFFIAFSYAVIRP